MLRLTNTLTATQEVFSPQDDTTVRMYACGPTVHDFAHIGNFRTYVFEDVLRRHLRSKGWQVRHVMNVTDVDDKIIRKSLEKGMDIRTYTERFTHAFFEDAERLRIERPEVVAAATDHVQRMVDLVKRLLAKGYAYKEADSIYFRIARFATYGRLAKLDRRDLIAGARVDVDEYEKEEPRDFVLWKAPKDDKEPRWETEIGPGRPGWHLECSAMAMEYLGETIDIHCGAVDLIFPHHENEIAQSEAATGVQFVRFWVHAEHLIVEGEKMAKSKGNYFTLRDLIERGFDPIAIRYLLVSVPYRKQLNFTFEGLHQAVRALDRIKEFLFRLRTASLHPGTKYDLTELLRKSQLQFEAALDDDLNTARALAAVFDLIREINIALEQGTVLEQNRQSILAWFQTVDDRLAIISDPGMPGHAAASGSEGVDSDIEELIVQRNEARKNRNFALADQIRDQLLQRNILIEDTRAGTKWRRK